MSIMLIKQEIEYSILITTSEYQVILSCSTRNMLHQRASKKTGLGNERCNYLRKTK